MQKPPEPAQMTNARELVTQLESRLEELRARVGELDTELRAPLSADFEEQASDLENQEALTAVENTVLAEITQIEAALRRLSAGTYGACERCGTSIPAQRLAALPTATRCVNCAD